MNSISRKIWIFVVLGLIFGSMSTQARPLSEILKSKELRICLVVDNGVASAEPPDCRDNCRFSGRVYEESLVFAKSLGQDIQPKFIQVDWDEQFFNDQGIIENGKEYTPALLENGTCDIYPSNLTRLDWREKMMDFVVQFPNRMMVVIHKDNKPKFKKLEDLAGKKAGTTPNTSYEEWLLNQNKTVFSQNPIHIDSIPDEKDILSKLQKKQIDFTLLDAMVAILTVRNLALNCSVAFPVGPTDEIGWAFRKQDKDLQIAVNNFFQSQLHDHLSELNQIWQA